MNLPWIIIEDVKGPVKEGKPKQKILYVPMNKIEYELRPAIVSGFQRIEVTHFTGPAPEGFLEQEFSEWIDHLRG